MTRLFVKTKKERKASGAADRTEEAKILLRVMKVDWK